jgi:hypothetical protein
VEIRRAPPAARVDKMPPRRGTSLVPLQRVCRRPTLRAACGEAVPARPRLRVPPVLWISLCEPIRKPTVSRHQPSAEDQDASRRERQSPRTVSQKTARDAPENLLSATCQGDGGAGALLAPGGARPESLACSAAKSAKDEVSAVQSSRIAAASANAAADDGEYAPLIHFRSGQRRSLRTRSRERWEPRSGRGSPKSSPKVVHSIVDPAGASS